jgi:hypothetical protein
LIFSDKAQYFCTTVKKITAIIVCLSLLLQCVAHLGVIGYYQLNKEYIAKNLCENRDKPKMNCCGKCYLKKQLRKIDNNSGTQGQRSVKTEKSEVMYLIPDTIALELPNRAASIAVLNPLERHLYHTAYLGTVFHPPAGMC